MRLLDQLHLFGNFSKWATGPVGFVRFCLPQFHEIAIIFEGLLNLQKLPIGNDHKFFTAVFFNDLRMHWLTYLLVCFSPMENPISWATPSKNLFIPCAETNEPFFPVAINVAFWAA
jgi:hypothetical protein